MVGPDDYDMSELRVSEDLIAQETGRRARKVRLAQSGWQRHGTFLPRAWEVRLQGAKQVATYRLGLELLYRHWRSGGHDVDVSNIIAAAVGVPRTTKTRALQELEALELIQVQRKTGRSPRATPLHAEGLFPPGHRKPPPRQRRPTRMRAGRGV